MCFQQAARQVRKVVDDLSGHTDRKAAASQAREDLRRKQEQTGLIGRRSDNGSVSRLARANTRKARGFRKTVFTSLLGDTSFGKSIKSALKLGHTS